MKKRIISLILVLVIATLSFASCGFSFTKGDLSVYGTFSAEQKAAFEKAWLELYVDDGDFTTDEEMRAKKVLDSIYADLAESVQSDAEKLKEGVVKGHDKFFYNYYCTADFGDEKGVVLFAGNMASGKTATVQFGLAAPSDLEVAIETLLKDVDLKDKTYLTETSGNVAEGDVVYVSYSYTHLVVVDTDENGDPVSKTETVNVENERLVLTAGASALVDHLLKKDTDNKTAAINSSTITDLEITKEEKYTGIKINWRAKGAELGTVKDVTFEDSKKVNDVYGKERELKDVELTYHIYPSHYISVPEYTAENLMNIIFDDAITVNAVAAVLFGRDFLEKEEDEIKTELDKYTIKELVNGDKKNEEKDVKLEDFVEALADLQEAFHTAEESLDSAESDRDKKKTAYDTALSAYEADKTEAKEDSMNKAKKALDSAEKLLKAAEKNLETARNARDFKIATLFASKDGRAATLIELQNKFYEAQSPYLTAKKTYDDADAAYEKALAAYEEDASDSNKKAMEKAEDELEAAKIALEEPENKYNAAVKARADEVSKIIAADDLGMAKTLLDGYKSFTYDYLLEVYNEDIRMKLAKEIYALMEKNVTVSALPENIVDDTYDQLIDNYKYEFYNGNYDSGSSTSSNKVSNYKQYKGNFKSYLIDAVSDQSVKTYDDACKVVREKAQDYVKPIVMIFMLAEAYDLRLTDKEVKEYKNDEDGDYGNIEYAYGETSAIYAYQFDKLMNYILEFEEDEETGAYVYENVKYVLGEKPEAEEEEK